MFNTHADCRACGHWHYWHPDTLIKNGCNRYGNQKGCYCTKQTFVPSDNLLYLEWKYEQKEKV